MSIEPLVHTFSYIIFALKCIRRFVVHQAFACFCRRQRATSLILCDRAACTYIYVCVSLQCAAYKYLCMYKAYNTTGCLVCVLTPWAESWLCPLSPRTTRPVVLSYVSLVSMSLVCVLYPRGGVLVMSIEPLVHTFSYIIFALAFVDNCSILLIREVFLALTMTQIVILCHPDSFCLTAVRDWRQVFSPGRQGTPTVITPERELTYVAASCANYDPCDLVSLYTYFLSRSGACAIPYMLR